MYVKRTIEEAILRLGQSFPCIVIYGAKIRKSPAKIRRAFRE